MRNKEHEDRKRIFVLPGASPFYKGAQQDVFGLTQRLGLQGPVDGKRWALESFRSSPELIKLPIISSRHNARRNPEADLMFGYPLKFSNDLPTEEVKISEEKAAWIEVRSQTENEANESPVLANPMDHGVAPRRLTWSPSGFYMATKVEHREDADAIWRLADGLKNGKADSLVHVFRTHVGALPGSTEKPIYRQEFLQCPSLILVIGKEKHIPQELVDGALEAARHFQKIQELYKRKVVREQTARLHEFCPEIKLFAFSLSDLPGMGSSLGTMYDYAYWAESDEILYQVGEEGERFGGYYSVEEMSRILSDLIREKQRRHGLRDRSRFDHVLFRKGDVARAA